jgi:hypothetical protein
MKFIYVFVIALSYAAGAFGQGSLASEIDREVKEMHYHWAENGKNLAGDIDE